MSPERQILIFVTKGHSYFAREGQRRLPSGVKHARLFHFVLSNIAAWPPNWVRSKSCRNAPSDKARRSMFSLYLLLFSSRLPLLQTTITEAIMKRAISETYPPTVFRRNLVNESICFIQSSYLLSKNGCKGTKNNWESPYCHPKTLYLDPYNLLDNLLDIMSESRDCFFAAPALAHSL